MVEAIRQKISMSEFAGKARFGPTLSAIKAVPRHYFVPKAAQNYAYEDRPLPIGYGQTISAPYIVAVMTGLLQVDKGDSVLEIGTGSGYQAAILGQLVSQVYTIEIVEPLANEAAARLAGMGCSNVHVRTDDGYSGWAEHGPFDAIIVTAGATHIPPPLLAQLKPGGRMMIPLGPNRVQEELMLVKKEKTGKVLQTSLAPVSFVDFTGKIKQCPCR